MRHLTLVCSARQNQDIPVLTHGSSAIAPRPRRAHQLRPVPVLTHGSSAIAPRPRPHQLFTNYAIRVSVHIRDMVSLSKAHPEIVAEFNNGNITVRKTRRAFSSKLQYADQARPFLLQGTVSPNIQVPMPAVPFLRP